MNEHTYPANDLINHDTETLDACLCGPTVVFVSGGAHVVHHSLDGREHTEPDHNYKTCPSCEGQTHGPRRNDGSS